MRSQHMCFKCSEYVYCVLAVIQQLDAQKLSIGLACSPCIIWSTIFLSPLLPQAFLASAASHAAFMPQPTALPPGGLSVVEQCRIRDRSTILARQLYAEQGQGFADSQVAHLLASLHIDPGQLPGELHHVHDAQWHSIWQQQQGGMKEPLMAADMAAAAQAANMEAVWREQQQRSRPWWVMGVG